MEEKTKKTLLITGAVLLGGIVLYKIFSPNSSNSIDSIFYSDKGALPVSSFNPKTVAKKLHDSMKETGTDEAEIIRILTPISQEQFTLVRKEFGTKQYNSTTGNQYAIWGFDLPFVNLPGWLKSELSAKEYKTLQLKYPNHL